jgi:uracil-DNA glycosylase family 4
MSVPGGSELQDPPLVLPAEIAPTMSSWEVLAQAARRCVACPELAATRTLVVPGVRTEQSDVLVVGEAPGAQEDATGVPFVGKAGQLLATLLAEAGLAESRVAITNTLKCRPPSNRTPRREEIGRCRPWLAQQIALLDPLLIVALGGTAAGWFFGTGARIADLRREPQSYDGRTVIVSYHPSAAIRFGPRGAPLAALRQDLAAAAELAEGLRS